jgi:hypothetical protein
MLRQNKLGCFSVTNISRLNLRLQGKALGVTTDTQHNNLKTSTLRITLRRVWFVLSVAIKPIMLLGVYAECRYSECHGAST